MNSQNPDSYYYIDCILCSLPKKAGPNVYDIKHVSDWKVSICRDCLGRNSDGIIPERHPLLMEHLKREGVAYSLDDNRLLQLPSSLPSGLQPALRRR